MVTNFEKNNVFDNEQVFSFKNDLQKIFDLEDMIQFDPKMINFNPKMIRFDPKMINFDPKMIHFDQKMINFEPKIFQKI